MADDIIILLCYPDTSLKLQILRDQIQDIRNSLDLPIALASHLPVPPDIIDQLDYFIYDRDDAPSNDYTIYYHYSTSDLSLKTVRPLPYHALSALTSTKNAISLLRQRYLNAHLFEYDTLARYPLYIKLAQEKLLTHQFVGANYYVPLQQLSGIYMSFYSFSLSWLDSNLPAISSWEEYKSYGLDKNDNLMLENWMYNYFLSHSLLPSCYFLTPSKWDDCIISVNIQSPRNLEPGLRAYLSELPDHRLILFVHQYGAGTLNLTINHNGTLFPLTLSNGLIYWKVIPKSGHLSVNSTFQSLEFDIDPNIEYTSTLFKFKDNRLKCLKEYDG